LISKPAGQNLSLGEGEPFPLSFAVAKIQVPNNRFQTEMEEKKEITFVRDI